MMRAQLQGLQGGGLHLAASEEEAHSHPIDASDVLPHHVLGEDLQAFGVDLPALVIVVVHHLPCAEQAQGCVDHHQAVVVVLVVVVVVVVP